MPEPLPLSLTAHPGGAHTPAARQEPGGTVSEVAAFVPAQLGNAATSASVASGYATGYAAGFAAGSRAAAVAASAAASRAQECARVEAERRLRDTRAALAALAAAAEAARARTAPVLAEAISELRASAVDLAEALLGAELSQGDNSARAALGRALAARGEAEVVRIRLNPADLACVRAEPGGTRPPTGVELVPDAALAPGDALCDLEEGFLDARLAAAVERVRAALGVAR